GAAGFIGSHVAEALLRRGDTVVGVDNLNDYYDPRRKRTNLNEVAGGAADQGAFTLVEGDVRHPALLTPLFAANSFDAAGHLAAMAGVRISINHPSLYFDVNVHGTLGLLDGAVGRLTPGRRIGTTGTFVFASTSSAYGATRQIPFVETDPCNQPLAPYAASK